MACAVPALLCLLRALLVGHATMHSPTRRLLRVVEVSMVLWVVFQITVLITGTIPLLVLNTLAGVYVVVCIVVSARGLWLLHGLWHRTSPTSSSWHRLTQTIQLLKWITIELSILACLVIVYLFESTNLRTILNGIQTLIEIIGVMQVITF